MGKTVTEVVDVVDPLGNWSKAAAKLSVLAGQGRERREGEQARVAHINCCQCLNGNFLSFNARSPPLSPSLSMAASPGSSWHSLWPCLPQPDRHADRLKAQAGKVCLSGRIEYKHNTAQAVRGVNI